jgi:hypothetical protein
VALEALKGRNITGWLGLTLAVGAWGLGGVAAAIVVASVGFGVTCGILFGGAPLALFFLAYVVVLLTLAAGTVSAIGGLFFGLLGLRKRYAKRYMAKFAVGLSTTLLLFGAFLLVYSGLIHFFPSPGN